jgi:hypothetical protein
MLSSATSGELMHELAVIAHCRAAKLLLIGMPMGELANDHHARASLCGLETRILCQSPMGFLVGRRVLACSKLHFCIAGAESCDNVGCTKSHMFVVNLIKRYMHA